MTITTTTIQADSETPKTATAAVADAIRRGILDGTYQPLQYLRESALARELDVSRTPVREALRELVSEGWLEAIPHRGSRVTEWTENDAQEVFEIRLVLEPMAVGQACSNVTPDLIAKLQGLCQQMESLVPSAATDNEDRSRLAELNRLFHQHLIEASGNQRLGSVLESLVRSSVIRRNFINYDANHLRRSMHHHDEILQALLAGDRQWAENVMRTHLLAARGLHITAANTDVVHRHTC